MRQKVDHLLIGTGIAPLLAASRILRKGETVAVINPDPDFFLENSELPLDLFSFESAIPDIKQRFLNNLPDQVYRDLIADFPGALEMAPYGGGLVQSDYQVESAPWIRKRDRIWVAPKKTIMQDKMESLYLRVLDLGFKPKWMEGISLAKQFPGFAHKNLDNRNLEEWSGFVGPRFGDVDVSRYRVGLLTYLREKLGRENIMTSTNILETKGNQVVLKSKEGSPFTVDVKLSILYFWTPKLERSLQKLVEETDPRMLSSFLSSSTSQLWEEWDLISKTKIKANSVAHFGGIRIWASGDGAPSEEGYDQIKMMRRESSQFMLGDSSLQEVFKMIFDFMGWDRITVRSMVPRKIYRWHETSPLTLDFNNPKTMIVKGCDGPLHWIANQVKKTIDSL